MAPTHRIHLVGSMNLPSAEEAMTTASEVMGEALLRLPDGEPGPRRGWVFYQRSMFTHNRYLDVPGGAASNGRAEILAQRVLRAGVRAEDIEFPELGYAREAHTSYAWFRQARADGRIPRHLRFQVSLPTPFACLVAGLEVTAIPQVEPAYEAAMIREVAKICSDIPHEDLAIQWDICIEMVLFDGRSSLPFAFDEREHRARLRRLTSAVPKDVHLGVHLCYGDYNGKHVVEPKDGQKLTEFANLVTSESGRPLQWIHVPVPIARNDAAYFAPFANLRLHTETELFLGLVHHADGVEGTKARIRAAEKFIPKFGISTECGIGRMHSTTEIHELFHIHKRAATE
jgi:methionine synthase II (cobalamin-independent)